MHAPNPLLKHVLLLPAALACAEYWLHPQRYRTTLCRDGAACHRSVCFFAHGVEQLRPLTAPLDAAASDSPCSTKGKFGLSGLPAAAQRRRSQEKQARQQNCASASSCSRGGPARQGSGGITMQQRIALVGSNCGRSSSGSLDSVTIPLGHASLASISSNGCVASPVMPLPVLLPRASCMAAAAGGASGVGHLNDLLAAFQAQVISSHQRAAIAQAAVDEVSNQLQGFYTTLGGMPAACDTSVCMPDSSARYAGTACSSPNVYVGGQMQLQGSPVALSNSLSLPQSYAYSPTTAGSRGMQQQQALVSCSSMGPASSFAYNSADGSLLLQLSPAVSGSLAQPVLVAALSADAAFMNMPVAGVPAVATPQVGAGASGCYMQQLAGQSAGLAW
jgi:hypothetical protein